MKILAIMGSPRKGDSYEVAQLIEKRIKSLGEAEFEYLWLKDTHLELCKGCCMCFAKGENLCPLRDDKEKIENAIHAADGIIFASPVYVVNVTALMKNVIDRFAYVCHRPRFFDKYAMFVTTSAGFGASQTLQALDWAARTWGFNIVNKLGVIGFSLSSAALRKKSESRIERATTRFYNAVKKRKIFSPNLFSLICFKAQKAAFAKTDKESADFKYWEEKGWLERDARYYFPVKINIFKRIIASFIFKMMQLNQGGVF